MSTQIRSEDAPTRSLVPLWLLAAAMTVTAVVLLRAVSTGETGNGPHLDVPWWILAIGFGFAEVHALRLRFRSETHTITLNEIVLVVGMFGTTPAMVVLAQLVGAGIALAFVCRQSVRRLVFNLAQYALSSSLALAVFWFFADAHDAFEVRTSLAALAGVLASAAASLLAVVVAITVTDGLPPVKALASTAAFAILGACVNTALGLVVVIECNQSAAAAVLLVAPIATVFVAFGAYLSERSKSEGLEFLYEASEVLNRERDLEAGLLALLEFARESFHADVAEIVLRGDPIERIGYRTCSGPDDQLVRLEPVSVETVERVIAASASTTDSMLIAALEDGSGVRGAILLGRGDSGERFVKDDARLFETFANHLGVSLENERLTTSLARLRIAEQKLAHQAYHDSLTGLANRALFRDRVDAAIAESDHEGSAVGVMFIDLDDFKTVNDSKGHAAGDALLVEVGVRLAQCVGSRDTAARLGGDEFALLLRDVGHISQVHLLANDILSSLHEPIDVDGEPVVTRASIGVALHEDGTDAAELMQRADVAMYTAKRTGKGNFEQYEPSMSVRVAHRHQLKVGLERAVADGEFVLEYQPVNDVESGLISGTEALLRWKDPLRGLVAPSEFVGVAEETGLIVPIGHIVVQEACRQAAQWVREFPQHRLFVNLSPRELAHPDIVRDVTMALTMSGLPASHLVLEVTETAMMDDVDDARAKLQALKDLGVSIALDDFGTGFSSLSYLRELPIDLLKIAKPIIDVICESKQDASFVKGIVELGHVVGMTVVAEGVERAEQAAKLRDIGCDLAQGHYFAKSMPPAQLLEMLRKSAEAHRRLSHLAV